LSIFNIWQRISQRKVIVTTVGLVLIGAISLCSTRVASAATPSPSATSDEKQQGLAAYYSKNLNWKRTASGERYNPNALTTAHNTLPFGTRVRITNTKIDRSVVARVNDRGPTSPGRILDVSRRIAKRLRFIKAGLTPVILEVVR
jgi:rare lipoprotein A